MTTSLTGERSRLAARDALPRRSAGGRLAIAMGRALWRGDRALAELRWAGITFVVIATLAVMAKLLDADDRGFDRAILLSIPAAAAGLVLGRSSAGRALMARREARYLLGPLAVGMMMIATGSMDMRTLELPSAAPLVVLALAYAAITPGYPLALLLVATGWVGALVAHAMLAGGAGLGAIVHDEFVVHGAVDITATTGLYVVVRIASQAEARAQRVASRSRARAEALETLGAIVRRFDGSRPVREVMPEVVDDIAAGFDVPLVSIYLPSGPTRLSMVGVAGYHSPFHEIEVGVGVIGRAAATRQTQFIPDVLADPDYVAARDDVRSEIATPIVHGSELLGVVNFEGTLRHPMTASHLAVAEMVARAIAASLHAARRADDRRERLQAIERVLEVSRGLVGDLDRERTTRSVAEAAAELLAADSVSIAGRDATGAFRISHEVHADPSIAGTPGRPLGADDLVAGEAIDRGVAAIHGTTMAMPIVIDGTVAAVLVAERPVGAAPFGELERRIADLLATQVAVALRNADRHATMRDAAVRDPLTGLLNRRYFDEAVEAALANARRSDAALSLIMLDLDHFSAVNNEHGHAAGDAVLRAVARAMAGAVRVGDTVARFGGEEFVVIAPGTETAEALLIAERMRAAIAGVAVRMDDKELSVTVSAGVASLTQNERDGKALFRAADSALLAAKRGGRDRVVAV